MKRSPDEKKGVMKRKILANPLGDIRAEADHAMLAKAFYETPDYLSLLESDDKVVVVGRRGTGKSAITYRLQKQWSDTKAAVLVVVAPEEHQTLSLAPLIAKTGSKFRVSGFECVFGPTGPDRSGLPKPDFAVAPPAADTL